MTSFNPNPFFRKTLITTALASTLVAANLLADGPLSVISRANVLTEGTPIHVRLAQTISSETAQRGDEVDFEVLGDIKLNGNVVIPTGSRAVGTITTADSKHHLGRGGKLDVNIDFVRLPSGDTIPLRGVQSVKGRGHITAMTTGIVATGLVFWPAAPLLLLVEGKDVVVPKGHESNLYTSVDYTIPPQVQVAPAVQVSPAAQVVLQVASAPQGASNGQVVILVGPAAQQGTSNNTAIAQTAICQPLANGWCIR